MEVVGAGGVGPAEISKKASYVCCARALKKVLGRVLRV